MLIICALLGYFVWLIITVVASDSGAYFIGKKYGKISFSESSPKTPSNVLFGEDSLNAFILIYLKKFSGYSTLKFDLNLKNHA